MDAQCGPLTDAQEKGLLERKYEQEMKRYKDELASFDQSLKNMLSRKLEKNLKRVQDAKVIHNVAKFVDYQKLMVLMGKGLRTHF